MTTGPSSKMRLCWQRSCRVWLLAVGATTMTCTPFKDDPLADSGDIDANAASPSDAGPLAAYASAGDGQTGAGTWPPCDLRKPFRPPTFVQGLTDTGATNMGGLRLSPDSLTAYFHASYPGHSGAFRDLYSATRAKPGGPFDQVTPLGDSTVNSSFDEVNPSVSADGLTLVFERYHSGWPSRLHYGTRTKVSVPFTYGGPISESDPAAQDRFPLLGAMGRVLYFSSTRNPGTGADIYRATWTGTGLGPWVTVLELDTPFYENAPVVTPDDLTIYFASNRPPRVSATGSDIWMAIRPSTDDPFSMPTNVAELNSPDGKHPTFISPDGCTLYFDTLVGGMDAQYIAQKPAR